MKTAKQRRSFPLALLSGLVLVTVSSPLASYAILGSVRSYETEPFAAQAQAKKTALQSRAARLQQRLGFERALDDCLEKRRTDSTLACPDINDIDSYRAFIRTDEDISQSGHAAAPSLSSKLAALTRRDRALVEQYAQSGSCPTTLAGKGLYVICTELLERQSDSITAPIRGYLNDRALRGLKRAAVQPNTLRDRIKQAQEGFGTLFDNLGGQQLHYQAR